MSVTKNLSPRAKLVLMLVLFASPVVASYLTFYFSPPARSGNYGELLPAKPLPDAILPSIEGGTYDTAALRGTWVLLHADSGVCPKASLPIFSYGSLTVVSFGVTTEPAAISP